MRQLLYILCKGICVYSTGGTVGVVLFRNTAHLYVVWWHGICTHVYVGAWVCASVWSPNMILFMTLCCVPLR